MPEPTIKRLGRIGSPYDKETEISARIKRRAPFSVKSTSVTPPGEVSVSTSGISTASGVSVGKPSLAQVNRAKWQDSVVGKGIGKVGDFLTSEKTGSAMRKIAPFASNIVNTFRKPPMPNRPVMENYTAVQKVDNSNELNQISREINAADKGAERVVDGNTAARIKQANLGTKLNAFSNSNAANRRENAEIATQKGYMDSQVSARNTERNNNYNRDLVEREISKQQFQSENLANAGDKLMAIQNENDKRAVDMEKTKVLMGMYRNSGVLAAERKRMKAAGMKDPTGLNWSDVPDGDVERTDVFKTERFGGRIKRYDGKLSKIR